MNFTDLNGNAAFLLGQRFLECWKKNLQCHLSDFALELVASAIQDLQIQSDKGLIGVAIPDSIVVVPNHSTLNISGYKLAGCNQSLMNLSDDLRPTWIVDNVGRIFKDAMWHISIFLRSSWRRNDDLFQSCLHNRWRVKLGRNEYHFKIGPIGRNLLNCEIGPLRRNRFPFQIGPLCAINMQCDNFGV
jgi:hypothetical protein